MRKICIISSKGGVAKTTTAINIAAGLSRKDKKVLILDMDPQGNVATCLGDTSEKDMYDFLFKGAEPKECIKPLGKNLDVITSKENLAEAEQKMMSKQGSELLLREKMSKVNGYDYIIIDCPPSMGMLNTNAMLYCDEAFIPAATDILGLKGLVNAIKLVRDTNDLFDHKLKVTKIIPTLYDMRNRVCKDVLNAIKNEFYELVTDPIRVNSKLKEAPGVGKSIFSYAKSSRGAKDYWKVVNSVLQDEITSGNDKSSRQKNEEVSVVRSAS